MTDEEFEFLVFDRIVKIQSVVNKEGEDKFYISYSGGKDSEVLSSLFDEALPGNRIPRVFFNTGIEYRMMVEHVQERAAEDDRIVIINSGVNIKNMLEEKGYPFKSKMHSEMVARYQSKGLVGSVKRSNCIIHHTTSTEPDAKAVPTTSMWKKIWM